MTPNAAGLLTAALPALFAAATMAGSPSGKPGLTLDPGPIPTLTVPSPPAPLAPPINPGYLPPPANGLSPILTQPGPVTTLPQRPPAPYAAPPSLPGPVDQQKERAFRNELIERQRQRERAGASPADPRTREIERQLNQPTGH